MAMTVAPEPTRISRAAMWFTASPSGSRFLLVVHGFSRSFNDSCRSFNVSPGSPFRLVHRFAWFTVSRGCSGPFQFPARPGLSHHIEQEADADFHDVKNPASQVDAAFAVHPAAHARGNLDDFEAGSVQQQNHFRLG